MDERGKLPSRRARDDVPQRQCGRRKSPPGLHRLPREAGMSRVRADQPNRSRRVGSHFGAGTATPHPPAAHTQSFPDRSTQFRAAAHRCGLNLSCPGVSPSAGPTCSGSTTSATGEHEDANGRLLGRGPRPPRRDGGPWRRVLPALVGRTIVGILCTEPYGEGSWMRGILSGRLVMHGLPGHRPAPLRPLSLVRPRRQIRGQARTEEGLT